MFKSPNWQEANLTGGGGGQQRRNPVRSEMESLNLGTVP